MPERMRSEVSEGHPRPPSAFGISPRAAGGEMSEVSASRYDKPHVNRTRRTG